ncbi:MAG: sulfite oxidase heme-binding subunit YedZ [Aestuariivirga sp.]
MTPFTDRAGRFSPLKTLTLAGLAAPAVYLAYRYWTFDLGPLPVKEALLVCGLWAVRFLIITLALTPAMRLLNWPKLALVRRMAGIGAFSYAALHFTLYIVNSKFNLGFVASEIVARIYLTIGFVALFGLSLLAATSTDWAVRRLGKRWKQLHRIVYGIAVLGLLHFFMQSKIDTSQATLMAGLFLTLMIYRLMIRWRLSFSPPLLAVAAVAGGLATALAEFAWYGLATGVDPWRIAQANAMLSFGLRPAVIVLLAGLGIAVVQCLRSWGLRIRHPDTRALSSAG